MFNGFIRVIRGKIRFEGFLSGPLKAQYPYGEGLGFKQLKGRQNLFLCMLYYL